MDQKTFDIIERISREHSHKTFGYLDEGDLRNEIWTICLEKLPDFDYERGELEHFLRVAVKNRLVNRFKDITKSVRSPCPRCPFYRPDETPDCGKCGDEKHLCSKWRKYQLSIESRNSLLNASEPQCERATSDNVLNRIAGSEIKEIIFKKIDPSYRHDLTQLISGGKISKQRLKRLKREITRIIDDKRDVKIVSLKVRGQNANT